MTMHKLLYDALKKDGVSVSRTWDKDGKRYLKRKGVRTGYAIQRTVTSPDTYFVFQTYTMLKDGEFIKSSQGDVIGNGPNPYFWFASRALLENYAVNELNVTLPAGTCVYHVLEQKKKEA